MSRLTSPGEVLSAPDFQKDGQEFFKEFDKIQHERDESLVRRLKDGLDAMLIYAGLFSAVNSAFLIYTLPDLKPDPADDTNGLLYQLIQQTMAPNQSAEIYYPSDTFSPDPSDLLVNKLFSLSLFISILGSFIAVLGRYWLTHYQGNSGEGVERERWTQLKRSLGAERWHLVSMLEQVLPFTLLVALAIFAAGFVTHLRGLDRTNGYLMVLPLEVMGGFVLGGYLFRLLDPFCPYRTPVEELVKWIGRFILILSSFVVVCVKKLTKEVASICNWLGRRIPATPWDLNGVKASRISQDDYGDSNSTHTELDQLISGRAERTNGYIELQMQPENLGNDIPGSPPTDAHLPQEQPTSFFSAFTNLIPVQISDFELKDFDTSWELHGHAISRVLNESDESCTLFQAAASLCTISSRSALEIVFDDQVSRNRLMRLLRTAVRDLDRSQKQGPIFKEIQEVEMPVVVFGTAFLHLCLSTGNVENLPDGENTVISPEPQTLTGSSRRSLKGKYSELKGVLQWHWHLQNDKFGRQPPVFTSTSLAAGLLMGCLEPHESVLDQESELLSYRLDSVSSEDPGLWSQLALLAMACNTQGGRTMSEKRQEGFKAIQDAYTTEKATPELADAVYRAIPSHMGEKTRLPCEVFKLAWKLFVHGREKGDAARAFGHHVPFLGILEAKVRDEEQSESYQSIPSGDRVETSASWRFQAKFVFRAVGHYAMCIMALGDVRHAENEEALSFMRCVRALVPSGRSKDGAPSNPAGGQSDSEKEYRSELEAFEDICRGFESFIRSGQIKRRLAPEDQWCFTQHESSPSPRRCVPPS
ncbi:hypothetical protein FRC04_007358 [Tulasnella sp. 424]|nr:hypothetical protein FRC04_007358 [Tulasnella sp. 424]KAG8971590.1 hypothetical protein FRC05_010936 [Tulasnella sp. 425]